MPGCNVPAPADRYCAQTLLALPLSNRQYTVGSHAHWISKLRPRIRRSCLRIRDRNGIASPGTVPGQPGYRTPAHSDRSAVRVARNAVGWHLTRGPLALVHEELARPPERVRACRWLQQRTQRDARLRALDRIVLVVGRWEADSVAAGSRR